MTMHDFETGPKRASLRRLVGEQIDMAPTAHPWESVAARIGDVEPESNPGKPNGTHRWLRVGVAASVVALFVALVVVGARSEPDALSDASVTGQTGPVALALVEEIGPDDWVVPKERPGEVEFQYAMRSDEQRSVWLGTDGQPERFVIHIGLDQQSAASAAEVMTGSQVWHVTDDVGGWRAVRATGTPVTVHGPGRFQVDGESILASLHVVATGALPFAPLDFDGPMTEVAVFDLDGDRYRLSVSEANGYFCTKVLSSAGGGGGCGGPLTQGVFASFAGGGGYSHEFGSRSITAEDSGIVSNDVDRVEVEFIDGTVVSVPATNDTGRFEEYRFWIAVADVQLPDGQSAEDVVPVRELRAFDASGALLDTARPST